MKTNSCGIKPGGLPGLSVSPGDNLGRVVFLGDSITLSGHYSTDVECWLLSRQVKAEVVNVGLSSESATDLTDEENAAHVKTHGFGHPLLGQRLDRTLKETRPDILFVCYGMNDGDGLPGTEQGVRRFGEAAARVRGEAMASGVKRVVFCTPPVHDTGPAAASAGPRDRKLAQYSDWLVGQRRQGWDVVDIHQPMRMELDEARRKDPSFRFAPDGVHPAREGHWLMAREILRQFFHADLAGISRAEDVLPVHGPDIRRLVLERNLLLNAAYLTLIGHLRPGLPGGPGAAPGPAMVDALATAGGITRQLVDLLQEERIVKKRNRIVHSRHPASCYYF